MVATGKDRSGVVGDFAPAHPPAAEYLTATEAARRLRTTDQSVRAWALSGCRIAGRVVKLASVMSGRRYLFTAAGCDQFVTDCTAARDRAAVDSHAGDRPTVRRDDAGYAAARAALDRTAR